MKTAIIMLLLLYVQIALPKVARRIYLDDKQTQAVRVGTGHSTILNFPTKASKVVLGNKGTFSVEYIENDLAVTALNHTARSNLFVYLDGRRFGFDLIAGNDTGDEIVIVRDIQEKGPRLKVRIRDE